MHHVAMDNAPCGEANRSTRRWPSLHGALFALCAKGLLDENFLAVLDVDSLVGFRADAAAAEVIDRTFCCLLSIFHFIDCVRVVVEDHPQFLCA